MELADHTDEALVGLLTTHEVGALEILYERHVRAIYSLAVLKLLGEPTARRGDHPGVLSQALAPP